MHIQLNTDSHINGEDSLADWASSELRSKLSRFQEQITRIEVHLSDTNAGRSGTDDKRCKLEARLAGRQPVAVSHDAGKVAEAFNGAVDKLSRALDTALGRVRDAHKRKSIRGDAVE